MLTSGTGQQQRIGAEAGTRTVAQAFDPTNWLPGSWFPQVIRPAELASPWLVVGVFVVLVALEALAVRRRSTRSVPGLTLVLVLVVVSVWVAAGLGLRLGVPMTLARWAWPVALLTVAVIIDVAVGMWLERTPEVSADDARSTASPLVRWSGLAAVVLLCAANVVPRDEGSGAKEQYRSTITEVLDRAGPPISELGRPAILVNYHPLAAETTGRVDGLARRTGHRVRP